MQYTASQITNITQSQLLCGNGDSIVNNIITDSRVLSDSNGSLFIALVGEYNNGHEYLSQVYESGVRNFCVSQDIDVSKYSGATIIKTHNTLIALQKLAEYHRKQFYMPVIGIIGSNGKTIVKEWIYQLLKSDFNIYRSPRSYNSQLGVALSVLGIKSEYNLYVFEAGISQKGEMEKLEPMIKPDMVIFTHLGSAHDQGFKDLNEKIEEKLKLAYNCDCIIVPLIHIELQKAISKFQQSHFTKIITWGYNIPATVNIVNVEKKQNITRIHGIYKSSPLQFDIPFVDDASIENAISCLCSLIALERLDQEHLNKFSQLQSIDMRLQMIRGINDSIIINDTYNADLESLKVALNFLERQNPRIEKSVILSDFQQSGLESPILYQQISDLINRYKPNRFIGIGVELIKFSSLFKVETSEFYNNTIDFLSKIRLNEWKQQMILIKGSRVFEFEKISKVFEKKSHQTLLEINLSALTQNLHYFKKQLTPETKIMVMVKAFGYGSGSHELAMLLENQKVDYLAVAYADEGVELREAGVTLPIMVMSPESNNFHLMADYSLEPEIYSMIQLKEYVNFLVENQYTKWPDIHIEIDTGMHRLGFQIEDIPELLTFLKSQPQIKIKSVFTHLASADEKELDSYTFEQLKLFNQLTDEIQSHIGYKFLKHTSNTAGTIRFNHEIPMGMIRLGIGLYGIDPTHTIQEHLSPVSKFKSVVIQTKKIKKGEGIGYNRKMIAKNDMNIAIVAVGYADGLSRLLSNQVGCLYIQNKSYPIVGNICMDMCMIDIGKDSIKAGDEVVIFEHAFQLNQIALKCQTIPYEILTNISSRVNRKYTIE